ncbi:unnamed protein product [Penicillium discolor]
MVREAQSSQTFEYQLRFNSFPKPPGVRLQRSQLAREIFKNHTCLHMILDRYEEAIQGRVNTHLNELERVGETDGQARDLFTPRVKSLLSDLSVLFQCVNQLIPYTPWVSTFYHEAKRGIIMANYSGTPGDISDRKFRYSIDRRRAHEPTVTLQAAERALDSFWRKVDNLVSSRQGCLPEVLTKLLRSNRVVQCNPDRVEPLKREPETRQ